MLDKLVSKGNKSTRDGFGAGLAEVGRKNDQVVALCADLIGSLKMQEFIKDNPERFYQMGIAEANMMGVAAGLAIGGKIPYTGTFANFSTGRVYDQIRQSIAYSGKNVKICASHALVIIIKQKQQPLLSQIIMALFTCVLVVQDGPFLHQRIRNLKLVKP